MIRCHRGTIAQATMRDAFVMSPFAKTSLWVLALAVLVAIGLLLLPGEGKVSRSYATAAVKRGDLLATVSATGTLSPLVTVQVGSQVSGTIQSLNANFNSRVRKGEIIAQIEPSLFKAKVAQEQANLQSAKSNLAKAQVGVREALRQLERIKKLRKQNTVSQSDLDAAQFGYEGALAELQVREAAIAQAQASLDQAKVNLAHSTIYAPIDGVVLSRDVDVGQTVAASFQAPTLYTIAQDLARMQIEADVDESYIGRIQVGQTVSFTVFAYPERVFHGEVAQMRLNPKVEAGVVKYNVIIHVDNSDLDLKPGMTATVAIEVAHHENVLKVPNSALRFIPKMSAAKLEAVRKRLQKGQVVVWTPTTDGLEPLIATVGLVGEKYTEVSGSGLKEGQKVVIPSRKQSQGSARRHFGLF